MTTESPSPPDEKPPDTPPSPLMNAVDVGCSAALLEGCAEGCGCLLTAAGAFAATVVWGLVCLAGA